MGYQAVLFDLFGTLAEFSYTQYEAMLGRVAALFGVSRAGLAAKLEASSPDQELGMVWWQDALDEAWQELGGHPSPGGREDAFREYLFFERSMLMPKAGALDVLKALKGSGLPMGLVSNTLQPVPELWPGCLLSPFIDAAVFSCVERIRKPDPAIYHLACARLGVSPEETVFVGDGTAQELSGALAAGLRAVKCCVPDGDPHRIDFLARQEWDGPWVDTFEELRLLVRGDRT